MFKGKEIFRQYLNIEMMFEHGKDIDQKIYDAKLNAMRFIAHYIKFDKSLKNELSIIREL